MLKKVAPILAVLVFAVGILFISVGQLGKSVKPSFAAASLKFSVPPSSEATISPKPKSEYYLVYPGILPDHPFYKFKMIRDRIWLLLTTDPLKKAELYLLLADKRIGAGKVLVEGNKVPLGISTLIKGEKYFEKAITGAAQAKKKGKDIKNLSDKLESASLGYEGILSGLLGKVSSEGKPALEKILELVKNLQEKAQPLN